MYRICARNARIRVTQPWAHAVDARSPDVRTQDPPNTKQHDKPLCATRDNSTNMDPIDEAIEAIEPREPED